MDNKKAFELSRKILKEVFGREIHLSLEEIEKKFAFDIPLPSRVKCDLSGKETWIFSAEKEFKIASQRAVAERFKKDEWVRPKRPIKSIEDILRYWKEINYLTAEKQINSKEVVCSDGVYNSLEIYKSVSVFDSKKLVFCYKIVNSSYMLASRDSLGCSFGVRVNDSVYCSSSFEVSWSNKVSRSFFIHDSFDLYECMFCSHLRSKRYFIANMPFEKQEYFKIKRMVVEWILNGN